MALTGNGSELEQDTIFERVRRLEQNKNISCYKITETEQAVVTMTTRFPLQYRLYKRSNGELILQGEYFISGIKDGTKFSECQWKDIETIEEK